MYSREPRAARAGPGPPGMRQAKVGQSRQGGLKGSWPGHSDPGSQLPRLGGSGHTSAWLGRVGPTLSPCPRLSFLPFLPEVGKTLGSHSCSHSSPSPLGRGPCSPGPHGQQSRAKLPQADLAGSEAAEASSGASVLGPVGPSVMVTGARGGEGTGGARLQGHPSFGMRCSCS